MGLWDDVSSAISGGSSSSSSGSISLPSISFPSLNLGSAPSIPSFGSIGSIDLSGMNLGSWSGIMPGLNTSIESITEKINNVLSSVTAIGHIPGSGIYGPTGILNVPIEEIQSTTVGTLTQFQQDFNAQLSTLSTNIQQSLKPFWDKITDVGALMELLSNPETIIIIVAVVAAVGIALYLAYKFYWSKVEFGESVADKYTSKGLEAAKIFK